MRQGSTRRVVLGVARRGALVVALLAGTALPALAQSFEGGNEAWLGQVGGANVLDILQDGRDNQAGADYTYLLLGQSGIGNTLTLEQIGIGNKLGTLFADEPAFARGVWQRGDLNTIDIVQRNTGTTGANHLGSIQQSSPFALPDDSDAFNALRVIQTSAGDASGHGGHYIGRIVQQLTGGRTATRNSVFIVQRGGGLGAGNILANVHQVGSGNSFGTTQSGDRNRVGEVPPPDGSLPIGGVWQRGTDNDARLVQTGSSNLVEYLQQYGHDNTAQLRLAGDGNVVSQAYQNNESWGLAGDGNRLSITIGGDHNGGTGEGWVGELIQVPSLATPGIAQAVFLQLGDDNDISLTILAGLESKYGVTQIGDGNDAHLSIAGLGGADAERNETAVFQKGDVNYVSHKVTGSDNAGAFRQEGHGNTIRTTQSGDSNLVLATQTGDGNLARVDIDGNDNNGTGSGLFGSAWNTSLEASVTLTRGMVVQDGALNSAALDVTGDANAFALYQQGSGHSISGAVSGSHNALAVVQNAVSNTALVNQAGTGNALGIRQF